jgi:hypothetical protein
MEKITATGETTIEAGIAVWREQPMILKLRGSETAK